jgi:SAM-dependent methyltransferase
MRLDDPDNVREQYRTTDRLETRISVWQAAEDGRTPQDVAMEALRAVNPARLLEVGPGTGRFAARCAAELGCEVVGADTSPAMVAATREAGIKAVQADVQDLPFADGSFDAAVAAWMLYHVPDVDRALAELARVLRPGGRLVAVTNSRDHLAVMWQLVGGRRLESSFSRENGEEQLLRRFPRVERRDVETRAVFRDRQTVVDYVSTLADASVAARVPELEGPYEAQGVSTVFVADKSPL